MSAGADPHTLPAVVICEPAHAGLRVAALTLLDRLLVALHRGGAGPITIIIAGELPNLRRARAWKIPFTVASAMPPLAGPILVAECGLLVQAADVRECLKRRGRLVSATGEPLPLGVAVGTKGSVAEMIAQAAPVPAQGIALRVIDLASAKVATRALWASLTSSADGLVDRWFNRPCGRPLSKLLVHTPVSPNAVSLASILIGLIAAFCFTLGNHSLAVLGALLFQLSAIVDCVDGDIARAVFKESPFGKWLDLAGDQVVHISVFAGIAIGVAKSGTAPGVLWLGASAIVGALLSFVVVVRGMKRRSETDGGALQRLIDAATNRDFSVVVLILAFPGRLDWFLWMAAIGSHLFWITALALQFRMSPTHRFVP